MLDTYLTAFLDHELPFDPWILVVVWIVLFLASHLIVRSARTALRLQQSIVAEENSLLNRSSEPKYVVAQSLFASLVFAAALFIGGPFCTFFGGGLVVAGAFALGLNYHALMFARALNHPGSARGHVELSASFSFVSSGYRLLGGALACLVLALVLANLALLGGALFLGSTGVGLLRRGHSVRV